MITALKPTESTAPPSVPAEAATEDAYYESIRNELQSAVDRRHRNQLIIRNLGRLVVLVAFVGLWNFSVNRWVDDFWVSPPRAVWDQLWEWIGDGTIQHHLTYTLQAMLLGLVFGTISGIILGFLLGSSRFLSEIFEPFVMVIYSIPKVAIAPLFVLWFGIGLGSKILIAAIIVFFLVFYNTYAGVRAVEQDMIDSVRIMGANRAEVIWNVVLPSAAGHIYTGVSMAVPYSLIGAIVGELIASNRGLGYLLRASSGTFDTAGTFASLVVLAAVGAIVNGAVRWHQSRTSRWRQSQGHAGNVL